jgi:hypothetical protein
MHFIKRNQLIDELSGIPGNVPLMNRYTPYIVFCLLLSSKKMTGLHEDLFTMIQEWRAKPLKLLFCLDRLVN